MLKQHCMMLDMAMSSRPPAALAPVDGKGQERMCAAAVGEICKGFVYFL